MIIKQNRLLFILSALCVPFLFLISPKWLALQGVPPCWGVLWLLPWSLNNGKYFGLISGFSLGLILDAFSIGDATQVPALMILGFCWGQIGNKGESIRLIFNLGLLAQIGSMFFGITIWIQNSFLEDFLYSSWFHSWSFHTLLLQSILTGLIAPIACSWILIKNTRQKRPI